MDPKFHDYEKFVIDDCEKTISIKSLDVSKSSTENEEEIPFKQIIPIIKKPEKKPKKSTKKNLQEIIISKPQNVVLDEKLEINLEKIVENKIKEFFLNQVNKNSNSDKVETIMNTTKTNTNKEE